MGFSQCNPFSPNQPFHSNVTKEGEEESSCGKDIATGFPSTALLPFLCLLKKEKITSTFCSLFHYVICIGTS